MKPTKNRYFCPQSGRIKMKFETEKKADSFIKFNSSEIDTGDSELRVYYCAACGGYHITKARLSRFYIEKDRKQGSTSSDIQAQDIYDSLKKKYKNKKSAIKNIESRDLDKEVKEKAIKKIEEANPIRFLELDRKTLTIARKLYSKIPRDKKTHDEKEKYILETIKTRLIRDYMIFLNNLEE